MPDRLPPLTALRAFDAAARHMSFAKAAEELNVTPAALSFQIKSLEEHLGAPLFHRLPRAVRLTQAGEALAPGLAAGFEAMQAAWRSTVQATRTNVLVVTAGPAFTSKWLVPRIFGFASAHPEIELRFAASLKFLDFARDGIDVAIRFGYGPDEGLFAEPLGLEWMTPAMSPAMAERYRRPEDLLTAPLIFDDSIDFLRPRCDWPTWFRAEGIEVPALTGAHFSNADHAIDAALSGVGVVLGRASLMARDVNEGRLVAPFATGLTTRANFRFVCPRGAEARAPVAAFRAWLKAESEAINPLREGRRLVSVEEME